MDAPVDDEIEGLREDARAGRDVKPRAQRLLQRGELAHDSLGGLVGILHEAADGASSKAVAARLEAWLAVRAPQSNSPPTLAPGVPAAWTFPTGGDRYQVGAAIGRGGMGEVRSVWDLALDREIAVKKLTGHDGSGGAASRFLREARVTARLEHPNIVPVHDIGRDPDGRPYFSMKRILGDSLATKIRNDDLGSLVNRLDLFRKVCDAVAFAHRRGIIHRDLKPSNVMIGDFGEVLVVDWGIAKRVGAGDEPADSTSMSTENPQDEALTRANDVLGTPGYMSPEQAWGKNDDVDARSDVYALGALLYALLTRRAPFVNGPAGVVAVREGRFAPPRQIAPGTPVELEAIVLRAMQLEPGNRYATVEALRSDVQAYLEGGFVGLYHYGPWARCQKWAAKHRGPVVAVVLTSAAAAVLLVASGAVFTVSVLRARDAAIAAEHRASVTSADAEVALAANQADIGQIEAARVSAADAAAQYAEAGVDPIAARLVASYAAWRSAPPILDWRAPVGTTLGTVTMTPDGGRVAYVDPKTGDVIILGVPGGEVTATWHFPDGAASTALLAAAGTVLTSYDDVAAKHLVVVDAVAGKVVARLPEDRPSTVIFAPDGSSLAALDATSTIHRYALPSGAALGVSIEAKGGISAYAAGRVVVHAPRDSVYTSASWVAVDDLDGHELLRLAETQVSLSPDGAIAAAIGDAGPELYDLGSGALRWKASLPSIAEITFLTDDLVAAWSRKDQSVHVWTVADGRPVFVQAEPAVTQLSADGRSILSNDQSGFRVYIAARPWPVDALPPNESYTSVAVSADGRLVATGGWGGHARVYEAGTGALLRDLLTAKEGTRDVAFTPDGRGLLTGDRDNHVRVFDLVHGALVRTLGDGTGGIVGGVAVLPGGHQALVLHTTGQLRRFDLDSGAELARWDIPTKSAWELHLSGDGATALVTGRDGEHSAIFLVDTATGAIRFQSASHGIAFNGALSSDPRGGEVIVGCARGALMLRDGKEIRFDDGDTDSNVAAGFTPDDRLVVTGDYSGRIKAWDPETAQPLRTWSVFDGGSITDLEFAPGTRTLYTVGGNAGFTRIDLDLADHLAATEPIRADRGFFALAEPARARKLVAGAALRGDWETVRQLLDATVDAHRDVDPVELARAHWATGDKAGARASLAAAIAKGGDVGTLEVWAATP